MRKGYNEQKYFQTNTRLVAEDDMYITLNIRVEKTTIVHYLPLMDALRDAVADSVNEAELI